MFAMLCLNDGFFNAPKDFAAKRNVASSSMHSISFWLTLFPIGIEKIITPSPAARNLLAASQVRFWLSDPPSVITRAMFCIPALSPVK